MSDDRKWIKKSTHDFKLIAQDESFVAKRFEILVFLHAAAFTDDVSFMDYIEYRLNLDRGTKGLIILQDIKVSDVDVFELLKKEKDNEVSNAA